MTDAEIARRVSDQAYDSAEGAATAAGEAEEALGDVIAEARELRRVRRTRPDRMTWRGRDLVGAAGVGNDGDRVEVVEDREVGEVTSHPLPLKRLRVVPRRIERFFHWQGRSTAERARRGRHGMTFVGHRMVKSAGVRQARRHGR